MSSLALFARMFAIGIAVAAPVGAFGLTALSSALVTWQAPLRLLGGAALVYLGLRAILLRTEPAPGTVDPLTARGLAPTYISAVGLTLTNPMTIMAFAAVFASTGLVARAGAAAATLATVGIASGSLAWWLVLVTGTSLVHAAAGETVRIWVSRVSGGFVALLGLAAIGSVVVR